MKLKRALLAVLAVLTVSGVAYVRQVTEPAGARMARAAERFLSVLNAEQRAKAAFAFDDKERFNWHFVPLQDRERKPTRKGLPLLEMSAEQREAALDLLRAGTSATGYVQATTIMSLESILHELEKGGAMVRHPEWYFFTVFGTPSNTGTWGWRVEGHHLSLNFTLDGSKVLSATPAMYGANPAIVKSGPRQGLKTLADVADLARQLVRSLDEAQKKVALQPKSFPEIAGQTIKPKIGEPQGLAAAQMTQNQKETLLRLLQAYTGRFPAEVAQSELAGLQAAGFDKIHFAYTGGVEPGEPHTYRIHGPTFLVEFLNEQPDSAKNPANHIHSAWRKPQGDFAVNN